MSTRRRAATMKIISRTLIFSMLHLCWLTSYVHAEMLPTESAVQSHVQDDKQRLLDLLNSQDVVDELEKYGISKVEAIARVESLTEKEAEELFAKMERMPIGGQTGGWGDSFGAIFLIILFFPFFIFWFIYESINGDSSSSSSVVDPSQGASCLEPCFSDFSDCMNSSENATEENKCEEEKAMCAQQCEGSYN